MTRILVLCISLLGTSLAFGQFPKEVQEESMRLAKRILAIGDLEKFASNVAELIQNDDCRGVLRFLSPKSPYFQDPEFIYAQCVFESRQIGDISSYKIGSRRFYATIIDGNRSLVPKVPILFGDSEDTNAIELELDLSGEKFMVMSMRFLYGRDQSYRSPQRMP